MFPPASRTDSPLSVPKRGGWQSKGSCTPSPFSPSRLKSSALPALWAARRLVRGVETAYGHLDDGVVAHLPCSNPCRSSPITLHSYAKLCCTYPVKAHLRRSPCKLTIEAGIVVLPSNLASTIKQHHPPRCTRPRVARESRRSRWSLLKLTYAQPDASLFCSGPRRGSPFAVPAGSHLCRAREAFLFNGKGFG